MAEIDDAAFRARDRECLGASVRLAAMGRAPAPDAAPPAYVATLFDQNAASFDDMLVDQLIEMGYPEALRTDYKYLPEFPVR